MISRIRIQGLFGSFDYDIDFNRLGTVSILTGPNGYGKTTILSIIHNLLSGRIVYFLTVPFKSISVEISNASSSCNIGLVKNKVAENIHGSDSNSPDELDVIYTEADPENDDKIIVKESFNVSEQTISRWERFFENSFSDKDNPLDWTLREIAELDREFSRNSANTRMSLASQGCRFVEQQRLIEIHTPDATFGRRHTRNIPTTQQKVFGIAQEIKRIYLSLSTKYSAKAQEIDSTFIGRLLDNKKVYSEEEYQAKILEIKSKLSNLASLQLTDNLFFDERYPEGLRPTLSLYVDDIIEKLSVFDTFFEKLNRFKSIMDSKYLANKKLVLNPRHGMSFEGTNGKTIPLETLSSGEQNLIVLYYTLIFETIPGSVILVDEPENSLHVAWQKEIFNDYSAIAEEKNIQVIMATHSPYIIEGNWDNVFELYRNPIEYKV